MTRDETNLLWKRCVAGAAIVIYSVMDETSFKVAQQIMLAIHNRKTGTRSVPVVVIANFANLADHAAYDFDNDREQAEHCGAFYAHGSVLDNRLMYQGRVHTITQLVHRVVLSMRNKGLYLLGARHRDTKPSSKSLKSTAPKSPWNEVSLFEAEEEDGSWFGWCGGRS